MKIEHDSRRYEDGFGVTHLVGWDDTSRAWYYWCDTKLEIPGRRNDDHDSRHAFVTCVRCLYRRQIFFIEERVGIGIINTRAMSKINFDLE